LRKSGRFNLLKSLWRTLSSRRLIAVFLLMALLLVLLTLGQTSSQGPVVEVETENGFYPFYSNGTYHLVVFSYTDNGTPLNSQGVKIVLTNSTTQISKTVRGTIGADGLTVLNFTSNEPWNAVLYLRGPTGCQSSVGYGIGPSNSTSGFLSYLQIYDHGFRNKAGFIVFYVSDKGKQAPQTQFRLSYSTDAGSIVFYVSDKGKQAPQTQFRLSYSADSRIHSEKAFNGTIDLGSAGNFSYTRIYPDYSSIPSNISTAYGTLQFKTDTGWKDVNNFYAPNGQCGVFIRPSQQYLEPQVYHAFFNTDILIVSLFGIIIAILSFGYPRASHSIELLVAKPLSRSDIMVSKYFASLIITGLAILFTLTVTDLLLQYYFGIFLNAHTFFFVFGTTLIVGAIFSSLTFLVTAIGKGFVSIFAVPLAIMFLFHYIFGTFIDGLFNLLQTLGISTPNNISTYAKYINPFQSVSGILRILEFTPGECSGVIPFSIRDMILFLFLWAFIPILIAIVIWRRSDP
jgi:ABC-type transport system involved in multi-copper enzyme maturation permease subunit